MSFENYFPLWNDLNTAQKKVISDNLITRDVKKGTIIHNFSGGFRFYDAVVNDRALIERAYACGMDY